MYTVSNHEAQHIKQTLLYHDSKMDILIKTRDTCFKKNTSCLKFTLNKAKKNKKQQKQYFAKIDIQIDEISNLRQKF